MTINILKSTEHVTVTRIQSQLFRVCKSDKL